MGDLMRRARAMVSVAALTALALFVGACAGTEEETVTVAAPTGIHDFYPLAEGARWAYLIRTDRGDAFTIFMAREVAPGQFDVAAQGGEPRRYELRDDGIYMPEVEGWLLRGPIAVGTRWSGAGGRAERITAVDQTVTVPAGTFEGCLRVESEPNDAGFRTTTDYCPHVGAAYLEHVTRLEISGAEVRVVGRLTDVHVPD